MGDMAKVLETSLPFLSMVENGKKNVPSEWIDKITEHYGLTPNEVCALREAMEESRTCFKINAGSAGDTQRKVALKFARSFEKMDDETANKILQLLSGKG